MFTRDKGEILKKRKPRANLKGLSFFPLSSETIKNNKTRVVERVPSLSFYASAYKVPSNQIDFGLLVSVCLCVNDNNNNNTSGRLILERWEDEKKTRKEWIASYTDRHMCVTAELCQF